jgi:hypothetical protein
MPYVDPEFVVPTIPEDEMYEGTDIDKSVLDGKDSTQERESICTRRI